MIEHVLPVLNFLALFIVLFRIQSIRRDLRLRLEQFQRIEAELLVTKHALRDCPVFHDVKLEKPTP